MYTYICIAVILCSYKFIIIINLAVVLVRCQKHFKKCVAGAIKNEIKHMLRYLRQMFF